MIKRVLFMYTVFFCTVLFVSLVIGGEKIVKEWNERGWQIFSDRKTLELLPDWLNQQIRFPSEDEVKLHIAYPSETAKSECFEWIKRVIKEEWIQEGLRFHLLALKSWAKYVSSKEKGRIDAFVVRFTMDDLPIHIVNTRSDLTIAVKFKKGGSVAQTERRDFILSIAKNIFNEEILPKEQNDIWISPNSKLDLTWGEWKPIDSRPTGVSAMLVKFYTDGGNVVFCVVKSYGGASPRHNLDKPLFSD